MVLIKLAGHGAGSGHNICPDGVCSLLPSPCLLLLRDSLCRHFPAAPKLVKQAEFIGGKAAPCQQEHQGSYAQADEKRLVAAGKGFDIVKINSC